MAQKNFYPKKFYIARSHENVLFSTKKMALLENNGFEKSLRKIYVILLNRRLSMD